MAEADHSQKVTEFCNLTGADADCARFYLEAAAWNTNMAMSNYYADEDHDSTAYLPPAEKAKGSTASGPRIATFANLTNNAEEEEEGQAFYAGGSERSGQQVLGPGKRKSGNQIVEELFDAVKKNCGELLHQPDKDNRMFHGTGYVLGSEGSASSASSNNAPTEIRLTLWKTGFTVDSGSLRDYHEPHNKEFLDSIRQGEVPLELRRQANGRETQVSLDDHSHEDYIPPKKVLQAFSGAGFRLGSISPQVTAAAASTDDRKKNEAEAQSCIKVDDSMPVTSIQIRLADGSRLVMNANHNHTVGDIRRFIVISRPEYSEFSLMTSFPTKELTDENATLEESALLNSVIVQKMK
ncbi:NSFL1 cofactor p47 isoform X1 [Parasteatoda tepidariorum]|uniref:NSFL1 cofactor p47 isoform X1 n=1 Tax=Parasteatoda tepidariorum TaxID=114398 RepID=UPI00077FB4E5|nr:NSFL1 cofactor p47 isoform X1 [Parasteatoda tepidariorum]